MKRRVGFVTKLAVGALLGCLPLFSIGAMAQTATTANDAWASADPVPYWWFHGSVEAGYRDFVNNPQDGYMKSNAPAGFPGVAGNSLAKYYEYTDIRPGAFGNFWLATGSRDGLYQVDAGGNNVGYDDQSYWFDASKAGEFYFNFGWDQTPHVYSRSAYTPYVVNGNALTTSCNTHALTNAAAVQALAACAHPTDIGIKRDTAFGSARWTPDDAWDFRAEYSHMDRTGTQVGSNTGGTAVTTQFPKPVDDTTQNYGLNGEYAGTSPWGQRIVLKLAYAGSTFTEHLGGDFFTIQSSNPAQPFGARQAAWPSNQANGFSGTAALDLPWKSRYVSTVSYTMMRQNDAFMPDTTDKTYAVPASSLNGAINTLLVNNVLTTKITSELTSKLTYRYYNFDNNTPELFFPNDYNRDYSGSTDNVNSLSMHYTKQNAGANLNWRPTKEWNLGAGYGYERYDWTRADVDGTNENSGKVYGDYKPYNWVTLRASGYYGVRRSENYDYLNHVGLFQWCQTGLGTAGCDASELYNPTYRQLMIDDRDTWKANVSMDLVAFHNFTLTPTLKYQEMKYGVDPLVQQGLQDSRKWATGIDAIYLINPDTSVMVGYMYERGSSVLYGNNCTNSGTGAGYPCTGPQTLTNDYVTVNTYTAAVRWGAIPDKLDTELRYTASRGTDDMKFYGGGTRFANGVPTDGQFPDNHTWFQRLDAVAVYTFDKQQLAQMGWKGGLKAKLHYTWERNTEDNWANDPLTPYTNTAGLNSTLWLGWYNPNYDVQILAGSLVANW
jgi:MtrB/PioB family decaheme-associated outer membrane protein